MRVLVCSWIEDEISYHLVYYAQKIFKEANSFSGELDHAQNVCPTKW